jgi:hypothetical protein
MNNKLTQDGIMSLFNNSLLMRHVACSGVFGMIAGATSGLYFTAQASALTTLTTTVQTVINGAIGGTTGVLIGKALHLGNTPTQKLLIVGGALALTTLALCPVLEMAHITARLGGSIFGVMVGYLTPPTRQELIQIANYIAPEAPAQVPLVLAVEHKSQLLQQEDDKNHTYSYSENFESVTFE